MLTNITPDGHIRWHYTIRVRLKDIRRDGQIQPATARVPPGEKPAIWFTTREDWEPLANKLKRGRDGSEKTCTREETECLGEGLYRIGVAERRPHMIGMRTSC